MALAAGYSIAAAAKALVRSLSTAAKRTVAQQAPDRTDPARFADSMKTPSYSRKSFAFL
jgi:hypothetical protein